MPEVTVIKLYYVCCAEQAGYDFLRSIMFIIEKLATFIPVRNSLLIQIK